MNQRLLTCHITDYLDIVCEPPSKWNRLSRVTPLSLLFLHVSTRKETSWEAVTTRKLSCITKKKQLLTETAKTKGEWEHFCISNDKQLTTHIEEMGRMWSEKLVSRTPFREYTHSCWPDASTMQSLLLASKRICDSDESSVKGKDSTCWTEIKCIVRSLGLRKHDKLQLNSLCKSFACKSINYKSLCCAFCGHCSN